MKTLKSLILLFTSLASIEPSDAMQQDSSSYQQYSPSQPGHIQKDWVDSFTKIENQVREEVKEAIRIAKESGDTASQNSNNLQSNQSKEYKYGGESGHKFFKATSKYVVIPTLVKFLTTIIEENKKKPLSDKEWNVLFNVTLTYLGKKRNEIAVETNTEQYEKFGTPFTDPDVIGKLIRPGSAMGDPLTSTTFPAFYSEMRDKVNSILKDILNRHAATHDKKPMPLNEFLKEIEKIEWLACSHPDALLDIDKKFHINKKSFVCIPCSNLSETRYVTFENIDNLSNQLIRWDPEETPTKYRHPMMYWHPIPNLEIHQEALKKHY